MGIAVKFEKNTTVVALKMEFHLASPLEILPVFNATLVVFTLLPMLLLVHIP